MKYRIAWKLFRRGVRGDIQRARGPVVRAWNREREGFTAMDGVFPEMGRPLRAPRLVRKLRGTKGSEIMWPEVVIFAIRECRTCWGFGMLAGQYCGCALGSFTDAYAGRYVIGEVLRWRPGRAPGQMVPRAVHMRGWLAQYEEGERVVRAKRKHIATTGDQSRGHALDFESYGDQARIARAKLIAGRLDLVSRTSWVLDVPTWPAASPRRGLMDLSQVPLLLP